MVSGDTSPFSSSTTSNWVAKVGGLPPRVRAIARAIKRKNPGWSLSRCIAVAINMVKYSAATGDTKLPGRQHERASTVAAHGAAVADWTAKKARSHSLSVVDLAGQEVPAGSAMVAIYPPPGVAKNVAVPGGLTPDDLHVTLAYLGKNLTRAQRRKAQHVVQSVAAQHPHLAGSVGGLGHFPDSGDGRPHFTPVDVPGLSEMRTKLVEQLGAAGVPVAGDHGFTPHMTLTYGDQAPPSVKPTPTRFRRLSLVVGGNKQHFPLTGSRSSVATNLSVFDPAKHPRGAKGSSSGGKFVPIGTARNKQAAAAQKNQKSRADYRSALQSSPAVRNQQLGKMSDRELAALTRTVYSFKSSDPKVVSERVAVANEMARRGYDVKDFGALGGGIKSDKKLPAAAKTARKAVKKTTKPAAAKKTGKPKHRADLAVLSTKTKNRLPDSAFAIPGSRKYPIHDRAHAANALARVAQHGSPMEKAAVRKAVARRYPGLVNKKAGS